MTPVEDLPDESAHWRGDEVVSPTEIDIRSGSYGALQYNWFGPFFNPQFVAARGDGDRVQPVVIWEKLQVGARETKDDTLRVAEYPAAWGKLIGVDALSERSGSVVWNAGHPLIEATDEGAREWVRKEVTEQRSADSAIGDRFDLGSNRAALLDSPDRLVAWLLSCLERGEASEWNRAEGADREFVEAIWRIVPGLDEFQQLVFVDYGFGTENLHTITASTWTTRRAEHLGLQLIETLGMPSEDWRLTPAVPEQA